MFNSIQFTRNNLSRSRHHEISDQVVVVARLRLQSHGRFRDGQNDEGEAMLRGIQHPRRAEARAGDNLPSGALHAAGWPGHKGESESGEDYLLFNLSCNILSRWVEKGLRRVRLCSSPILLTRRARAWPSSYSAPSRQGTLTSDPSSTNTSVYE